MNPITLFFTLVSAAVGGLFYAQQNLPVAIVFFVLNVILLYRLYR